MVIRMVKLCWLCLKTASGVMPLKSFCILYLFNYSVLQIFLCINSINYWIVFSILYSMCLSVLGTSFADYESCDLLESNLLPGQLKEMTKLPLVVYY